MNEIDSTYLIFEKLILLEKEIDDKMYKTRLDIQENLIKPTPKKKTLLKLQIYSYIEAGNEHENKNFWVLRIQGKVVNLQEGIRENDDMSPEYAEGEPEDSLKGGFFRKFSYFFDKIQIKFDKETTELADIEVVL